MFLLICRVDIVLFLGCMFKLFRCCLVPIRVLSWFCCLYGCLLGLKCIGGGCCVLVLDLMHALWFGVAGVWFGFARFVWASIS